MRRVQSAERVSQSDLSDNFVYQRSLLAYHRAAEMIGGTVLEIGSGSGYGVSLISPKCEKFLTIDKNIPPADLSVYPDVEFRQTKVPPLKGLDSNYFDFVISFQVIEHVKNDFLFLSEIHRVLKPGGKLLISTPNRKMSLTRNPWHVREYSVEEFRNLLSCEFSRVESFGVFGRQNVMEYYHRNRDAVRRITRLDPLDLQHRLPRWMLRIPYDILNRINRRRLLAENRELTSRITMKDYFIAPVSDDSFDLFYIAEK
ncbi:MAG: class I SAM-dependent methyltransferase [Rikenellaceae bacterium]|nr:class I SAM-dependent methyltransferase [Rikenellaceae bacterium]